MVVVNKGESLLPGFRFSPTEEELVGYFLLNKVMQPFMQFDCYIEEKNIYADAPWNIFTDNQDWSKLNDESAKKTQFYAFTKLKKNGKNVVRRVGCGKWHGQTGPKPVKNEYDNEIIGWKKMLTFELLNEGEGVSKLEKDEGHWIMHEYSLDKDFLKKWLENNVVFSHHEELVICHITRDYKCLRGSNKLLVDDQDDHAMKERIALNNIQENPRPPLLMIEREANGSSCFLIQQEDDQVMKEGIALNIQEDPRPPLLIEREADGSSCFLMQQEDEDQLKEDQEDSKIIQDFVSNDGPIQENSDFDFNLYLAELEKVLLGDDDIPSDNQLGERNSTTEEENPHANKKSRLN